MSSTHIKTINVVNAHSDKCLVTLNLGDRPFIHQTRYLMCAYAISIGADFKIVTDFGRKYNFPIDVNRNQVYVAKMGIIYDFLDHYQRIIIIDDTCIINKQTPNLFEIINVDELGAVHMTDTPSVKFNQQFITTEMDYQIDPEKYLSSGLLAVSKTHQSLFNTDNICQYVKLFQSDYPQEAYLNYMIHKNEAKIHLLPPSFCQIYVGHDPEQYKNIKKHLNRDYINDQYIMHINCYYKHQFFYVSYICDIYNNRCYMTPEIQLEFSLIDDLIHEINRLKKIQKNKFGMLVFGLGADSQLWYQATERKISFVECDQQRIDACLNIPIPTEHIVKYSYENINLMHSFTIPEKILDNFKIPIQFKNMSFDIILINAPSGALDTDPGKLIPIYWSSKYLSHKGTLIYVCCCDRLLEKYCLDKYFGKEYHKLLFHFSQMNETTKFLRIK